MVGMKPGGDNSYQFVHHPYDKIEDIKCHTNGNNRGYPRQEDTLDSFPHFLYHSLPLETRGCISESSTHCNSKGGAHMAPPPQKSQVITIVTKPSLSS